MCTHSLPLSSFQLQYQITQACAHGRRNLGNSHVHARVMNVACVQLVMQSDYITSEVDDVILSCCCPAGDFYFVDGCAAASDASVFHTAVVHTHSQEIPSCRQGRGLQGEWHGKAGPREEERRTNDISLAVWNWVHGVPSKCLWA